MADEVYLKTWVSDKLMSLMGYSHNVVVQYVIRLCKSFSRWIQIGSSVFTCAMSLLSFFWRKQLDFDAFSAAKEASSSVDLVSKLVDYGFSSSVDTRSFAQEIFAKVPHKQSGASVSSHKILICLS